MKVLMVCLGNICRSPMADGLLRKKVNELGLSVSVDSAGTAGYHIGEKPDPRMRAIAKNLGVNIDDLRARQFVVKDFDDFNLIYAMDASNYNNILSLARNDSDRSKVELILNELEPGKNLQVPDPYYGGEQGFIDVFNLLDAATDKIIQKLK
jgi:protein-tyrosine phosphatase